MNSPSLIANWNRAFLENGADGLKEKTKGRPPMTEKLKQEKNEQKINS